MHVPGPGIRLEKPKDGKKQTGSKEAPRRSGANGGAAPANATVETPLSRWKAEAAPSNGEANPSRTAAPWIFLGLPLAPVQVCACVCVFLCVCSS